MVILKEGYTKENISMSLPEKMCGGALNLFRMRNIFIIL